MSLVGIVANPASGKDIRRLVAYGSAFDNQEKVRIVRRVLLGLQAVGVDRICYMPDYYGIVPRALDSLKVDIPIHPLDFDTKADQRDSTEAARIMEAEGATCIVTLGGMEPIVSWPKGQQGCPSCRFPREPTMFSPLWSKRRSQDWLQVWLPHGRCR